MTLFALFLICTAVIVTPKRPPYARFRCAVYQTPRQKSLMKIEDRHLDWVANFNNEPLKRATGITLTVGQLNYLESVQGLEQHFSVKNETPSVIGSVMVACRFFHNGQLIAIGTHTC